MTCFEDYDMMKETPTERWERKSTEMRGKQMIYDVAMFFFVLFCVTFVIVSSVYGDQNAIVFSCLFCSTVLLYTLGIFYVRRKKLSNCLSPVDAVQIVCLLKRENCTLEFYETLEYEVYYEFRCGKNDDDHDHCIVQPFTRGNMSVLLIWFLSILLISLMTLVTHYHNTGGIFIMSALCAVGFFFLWFLTIVLFDFPGVGIPKRYLKLSLLEEIGYLSTENMKKLKAIMKRHDNYKRLLKQLTRSLTKSELESNESLSEKIKSLKEEHAQLKDEDFPQLQDDIVADLPIIDFSNFG